MANFKQIIAMCLEGASYAQITHALGCQTRRTHPCSMSLPKEVELALKYEVAYLRNHEYRRRSLENPQTPNR